MKVACSDPTRSAAIAAERRELGLTVTVPFAWAMIALVAALNTASAVMMLSSF
jgi:hypothetical protein